MANFRCYHQPVAFEVVSKDDFEGASSQMEGEAAFRMAERFFREGKKVQCIVADKDGNFLIALELNFPGRCHFSSLFALLSKR